MVKEYVFEGSNARTVIRVINADESLKMASAKEEQEPRDVAGEDESPEMEFAAEMQKPHNLAQYLLEEQKAKEQAQHRQFSKLLQSKNVAKICQYWKKNRLLASDEYQMLVFLATELEDDDEAERLICSYVYRYGLNSLKSKQLLQDLRFDKALKALPKDDEWSLSNEISVHTKLYDGFMMLQDD